MPDAPSTAEKLILVTWAEEWELLRLAEHRDGFKTVPSHHAELPTNKTADRCGVNRERVLSVIFRWRPASPDSLYYAERLLAEKEKDERPLRLVRGSH